MGKRKRRNFTPEQRAAAVKIVEEALALRVKTCSQVAARPIHRLTHRTKIRWDAGDMLALQL